MGKITQDAVAAALGDGWSLTLSNSTGNIQAALTNLKTMKPYTVVCKLKEGAERLVKAGLISDANLSVKLSYKSNEKLSNGEPIWKPFPQLWINQPSEIQQSVTQTKEAAQQNSSEVQQLKNTVAALTGMIAGIATTLNKLQASGTAIQEPVQQVLPVQPSIPVAPPEEVTAPPF